MLLYDLLLAVSGLYFSLSLSPDSLSGVDARLCCNILTFSSLIACFDAPFTGIGGLPTLPVELSLFYPSLGNSFLLINIILTDMLSFSLDGP